jgi:hypothetical protein
MDSDNMGKVLLFRTDFFESWLVGGSSSQLYLKCESKNKHLYAEYK